MCLSIVQGLKHQLRNLCARAPITTQQINLNEREIACRCITALQVQLRIQNIRQSRLKVQTVRTRDSYISRHSQAHRHKEREGERQVEVVSATHMVLITAFLPPQKGGGSLTSCEGYCDGQAGTDVLMYSVTCLSVGVSFGQMVRSRHSVPNKVTASRHNTNAPPGSFSLCFSHRQIQAIKLHNVFFF